MGMILELEQGGVGRLQGAGWVMAAGWAGGGKRAMPGWELGGR